VALRLGKKTLSKRGAEASAWVATLERATDELDLIHGDDEVAALAEFPKLFLGLVASSR
jgi:hypothetical protein